MSPPATYTVHVLVGLSDLHDVVQVLVTITTLLIMIEKTLVSIVVYSALNSTCPTV